MPNDDPKPGDLVAGRYRVITSLGRGGMGVVFAAGDLAAGRLVALKTLLPGTSASDEAVARFFREARAAMCLRSEHAARVFDVGELADGAPFMVMELLDGCDLGELIHEHGRFTWQDAVSCILQACRGVAEAHSAGIVHRDLKPSNLFLTRSATTGAPLLKVLDFGLAKAFFEGTDSSLTSSNTMIGSPEYMSPEQVRATRHVDVRSDIWSLGVCFYELLTGASPFSAPSTADTLVKILHGDPAPPHYVFPDVPTWVSEVVLRCLAKDAAGRYPDLTALAAALEPAAAVDPFPETNTPPPRLMAWQTEPHVQVMRLPEPPPEWTTVGYSLALIAMAAAAACTLMLYAASHSVTSRAAAASASEGGAWIAPAEPPDEVSAPVFIEPSAEGVSPAPSTSACAPLAGSSCNRTLPRALPPKPHFLPPFAAPTASHALDAARKPPAVY